MKRDEFTFHLRRLTECYGEKAYPDARTEQIWIWARRIDARTFSDLVSKLIGECERAPLLGKFKEFYGDLRGSSPPPKLECIYCDGGGFIPDDKPLPTAYACKCETGMSLSKTIGRWQGPWVRIVPTAGELAWARSAQVVTDTAKRMGNESSGT